MFKKPFKLQTQNLLKGSDKKKFRDIVSRQFSARLRPEDLDLLVPLKGNVSTAKIADSRMVLYFLESEPIFLDMNGRNDLIPTGSYFIYFGGFSNLK